MTSLIVLVITLSLVELVVTIEILLVLVVFWLEVWIVVRLIPLMIWVHLLIVSTIIHLTSVLVSLATSVLVVWLEYLGLRIHTRSLRLCLLLFFVENCLKSMLLCCIGSLMFNLRVSIGISVCWHESCSTSCHTTC